MLDTRQYDRDLTDVSCFPARVLRGLIEEQVYYNTDCRILVYHHPERGITLFVTDVNTIAAFANRSLMGIPQENCMWNLSSPLYSLTDLSQGSLRHCLSQSPEGQSGVSLGEFNVFLYVAVSNHCPLCVYQPTNRVYAVERVRCL